MRGDEAAERHADQVRLRPAQRIEHRADVGHMGLEGVVPGPVAVAVTSQVERDRANPPAEPEADIVPSLRRQLPAMQEECRLPVAAPVERVQSYAAGARQSEMTRRRGILERYAEPTGERRQQGEVGTLRPPVASSYDGGRISHAGRLSWSAERPNASGALRKPRSWPFWRLRNDV